MDNENQKYEVTLPNPSCPGEWKIMSDPLTREEALAFVQEYYGADEDGRVCLITLLAKKEKNDDK